MGKDYKDVTYDVPEEIQDMSNSDEHWAVLETAHSYIVIDQDDVAENPREWSNLGHMVCFHRKWSLGDKHVFDDPDHFMTTFKENEGKWIYLPLYLYDHSGITMSWKDVYPYNDVWDAGLVGYIYVSLEEVEKEYGKVDDETRMKALNVLKGEVEEYDNYLTGMVFGFRQFCKYCWDEIDSCWGFYGDDWDTNGLIDQVDFDKCDECKRREEHAWAETTAVGE